MFTVLELLRRTPRHPDRASAAQSSVLSSARRPSTGRPPQEAAYAEVRWVLNDLLPAECREWLWSDAYELGVTSRSLRAWQACFGTETAALAVAAGLSEDDLRYHLDGGPAPEPAALEMLADLNCFPFVPPAARSVHPKPLPLANARAFASLPG